MTSGSKSYADFQNEHTLVPLKIWCRPQDLDAVREYAAQLLRGGASRSHHREATDPPKNDWAELSRRALLMAQSWRDAEKKKNRERAARRRKPEHARATERFKSRPDPQPEPCRGKTVGPIPRVINEDPAQLRRVIQYHHPDKGNHGADVQLFLKAKEVLAQLRAKGR